MQKDYIEKLSESSENKFVEEYWTKKWEVDGLAPDLKKKIESLEEFDLVRKYILNFKKGSSILDGGCGKGEWTLYLADKGYECVGVDISKKTIDNLNNLYPKISFKCGDIRKTGFKDDCFDAYISWGTFEHFELGMGQCFSEAERILKKQGVLILTIPYQNLRQVIGGLKNRFIDRKKKYRFYQWRLNMEELRAEFEMNGFDLVEIMPVGKIEGIKRFIRHVVGFDPEKGVGNILLKIFDATNIVPKHWCYHMLIAVG